MLIEYEANFKIRNKLMIQLLKIDWRKREKRKNFKSFENNMVLIMFLKQKKSLLTDQMIPIQMKRLLLKNKWKQESREY